MSELIKRVLVAIVGIPVGLFIIYLGGIPFFITLAIVSSLAMLEYLNLQTKKGAFPNKSLGVVLNLIMLSFVFFFFTNENMLDSGIFLIILLILFAVLSLCFVLFSKNPNGLLSMGAIMSGLMYITVSFSLLILTREYYHLKTQPLMLNSLNGNKLLDIFIMDAKASSSCAFLVISTFISVWVCDSAAYFTGKSIGKHKLFPSVSPNKTWEGAVGGFFGGIIGFALPAYLLINDFPLVHSIVIGAIIGVIGQIGDLAESKLKRDAGVKDSSHLLPGHGGALDRFDSIMFVAPVVFIYLVAMIYFNVK